MDVTWTQVVHSASPGITVQLKLARDRLHLAELNRIDVTPKVIRVQLRRLRYLQNGRVWHHSLSHEICCARRHASSPRLSNGRIVFWAGPKITIKLPKPPTAASRPRRRALALQT